MARGLVGTQWITQEMPKHCLEPTQILRYLILTNPFTLKIIGLL